MAITGGVDPFDMDQMMELDMEVHHHEATQPVAALTTMADALPGLGIVAAVLGVVITMGSLGGPPEEIGEKVAAALVGTFLGILLCYGVAGPLSSNMAKTADEHNDYLHVLRVLLLAFLKGSAPMIAIELGRRRPFLRASGRPLMRWRSSAKGRAALPQHRRKPHSNALKTRRTNCFVTRAWLLATPQTQQNESKALHAAEKLIRTRVLYQGMTSVVPQLRRMNEGFSPCTMRRSRFQPFQQAFRKAL